MIKIHTHSIDIYWCKENFENLIGFDDGETMALLSELKIGREFAP